MTLHPYSYAVLRAVPRIERGEFVNVGVIIYCQHLDFLRAAIHLDPKRIRALDSRADIESIMKAAEAISLACSQPVGSARENSGLLTRFGILTAPRSTVLQPSAVHLGLTADPQATLDQLLRRLVLPPS